MGVTRKRDPGGINPKDGRKSPCRAWRPFYLVWRESVDMSKPLQSVVSPDQPPEPAAVWSGRPYALSRGVTVPDVIGLVVLIVAMAGLAGVTAVTLALL
jgi:hypothetical protein